MIDRNSTVIQKVTYLNSKIGPTLVAASIGIRDRKTVIEVVENLDEILSEEQMLRLDVLLEVWNTVAAAEGDDIGRGWMIGANPWLNEESAITALREDRFHQVTAAARAMVEDTPSF